MKWGDASSKILAIAGDGYISSYNLLQMGRVKQYKELCGYDVSGYLFSLYNNKILDSENIFESLEIDYKTEEILEIFKRDCKKISEFIIQNVRDDIMCNNEFNEDLFTHFIQTNNLEMYYTIINVDIINEIYNDVKDIFENIKEIKNDIDKFTNPLYHIIRTKNGPEQDLTIQNFKQIFNADNYDFIKYDRESEIEDINKTLIMKPERHTFIFIKEMLRCAKTLKKKYIGILYDRYSKNPDDTTINQGLVGRDTGYDNNGISICYTNIDSINRYEELWNSNFEDKTIKWNSKTTKYTNGILSGKNTFNDPKDYDGFSVASDDSVELKEPVIKKFKTQEEAKEYYNKELKEKMKGRGPNKIKQNDEGYYEANIRGNKKVYSCEEIYKNRRCNIENGAGYGFRPCYEDINDKSTLQWWFIHY